MSDSADEDANVARIGNRVFLYGGLSHASALECIQALHKASRMSSKCVHLHISSNGGDLHAGLALCAWMRHSCSKPIHTHADSFVGSTAALIFLHGTERSCSKSSIFLLHSLSFSAVGSLTHMKDDVKLAQHSQNCMLRIIRERTTVPAKVIKTMMQSDHGINWKRAMRWGLATQLV